METYQLIRRGLIHRNFCEDFHFTHRIKNRYAIYAVFDGCSTGVDSHFASALLAKTIKAELEFIDKEDLESSDLLLDALIYQSTQSLKEIRNALMLTTEELLSTMIVFVYDETTNSGNILAFGDGFVSVNGVNYLINQQNQPEYIAYYLDMINTFEDYEQIMADYGKKFKVDTLSDVSISTDGINSFEQQAISGIEENPPQVIGFLVQNDFLRNNPSMLARKCNILKTKFGLLNQDDIAIIRVINKV
jgi:hypothetical protein